MITAHLDQSKDQTNSTINDQEEVHVFNNDFFDPGMQQEMSSSQPITGEAFTATSQSIRGTIPPQGSIQPKWSHDNYIPKDTLDLNYQAELIENEMKANQRRHLTDSRNPSSPLEDLLKEADVALKKSQGLVKRISESSNSSPYYAPKESYSSPFDPYPKPLSQSANLSELGYNNAPKYTNLFRDSLPYRASELEKRSAPPPSFTATNVYTTQYQQDYNRESENKGYLPSSSLSSSSFSEQNFGNANLEAGQSNFGDWIGMKPTPQTLGAHVPGAGQRFSEAIPSMKSSRAYDLFPIQEAMESVSDTPREAKGRKFMFSGKNNVDQGSESNRLQPNQNSLQNAGSKVQSSRPNYEQAEGVYYYPEDLKPKTLIGDIRHSVGMNESNSRIETGELNENSVEYNSYTKNTDNSVNNQKVENMDNQIDDIIRRHLGSTSNPVSGRPSATSTVKFDAPQSSRKDRDLNINSNDLEINENSPRVQAHLKQNLAVSSSTFSKENLGAQKSLEQLQNAFSQNKYPSGSVQQVPFTGLNIVNAKSSYVTSDPMNYQSQGGQSYIQAEREFNSSLRFQESFPRAQGFETLKNQRRHTDTPNLDSPVRNQNNLEGQGFRKFTSPILDKYNNPFISEHVSTLLSPNRNQGQLTFEFKDRGLDQLEGSDFAIRNQEGKSDSNTQKEKTGAWSHTRPKEEAPKQHQHHQVEDEEEEEEEVEIYEQPAQTELMVYYPLFRAMELEDDKDTSVSSESEDQYDVGECVDEEKPPSLQMIKLNATNPNSPHRRSTAEKIHSNQLVDPFEGTEIFEEMVSVSPTSRVIKRDSFPAAKNKEYHEDPSIISEQGYDLNNDKERDFKPVPNVGFVQEASPDKKMKKLTFKNRLSEEKAPPTKEVEAVDEVIPDQGTSAQMVERISENKSRKKIFESKEVLSERRLHEEVDLSEKLLGGDIRKEREKPKKVIFSEKRDSDTRNVEALVEGLGENMHTFGLEEDPLSAKDLNARDIGSGGRVSLLKGHSPQKHVEEESFGDKRDDDSFPFQVKREAMDPTESFFDFEGENYITNDDYLKSTGEFKKNALPNRASVSFGPLSQSMERHSEVRKIQPNMRRKIKNSGYIWVFADSDLPLEKQLEVMPDNARANLRRIPLLTHCFNKMKEFDQSGL